MNGLPYYKAYPRDFIEGTIGMAFEVKGAYRLILDLIYMQNGKLPDDARYISGLLGCTIRKWKLIRSELVSIGKLQVSGEFLTNYRAVSELETLSKHKDKQRENRARPNKNKDLQSPKNHHLRDYPEPEPEPEPKKKELPVGSSKKNDEPDLKSDDSPKPPTPKQDKGTRLPKDWTLPENYREYAQQQGKPDHEIDLNAEDFRDYWTAIPGQKGVKTDWLATWRNRVRSAYWNTGHRNNAPRGSPANGNPDPNDHSLAAATQRIMNRRRNTTNGQNAEASPGSGRRDFGNVELLPPVAQNEF